MGQPMGRSQWFGHSGDPTHGRIAQGVRIVHAVAMAHQQSQSRCLTPPHRTFLGDERFLENLLVARAASTQAPPLLVPVNESKEMGVHKMSYVRVTYAYEMQC